MNRICLSSHPPSAASLEMFVLSKGAAKLPLQVAVRVVPLRIHQIDYYFSLPLRINYYLLRINNSSSARPPWMKEVRVFDTSVIIS